jgi:apolipoprotein D and lipocalin family protein
MNYAPCFRRHASVVFFLASCVHESKDTLPAVAQVNLLRFMGDWYVIASILTFLEKNAYNAVESYRFGADGTIATTFTFRKGVVCRTTKNV